MPLDQKIELYKRKVIAAVEQFLEYDIMLLNSEAHEQAISHRIAVYLECRIHGFDVDCEYNRHMNELKEVNLLLSDMSLSGGCCSGSCAIIQRVDNSSNTNAESVKKLFRPDIIVHSRGSDENNEIIIEIKKTKDCNFDKEKLKLMTKSDGDYKYKLGVFIKFNSDSSVIPGSWQATYIWFVNGEEWHI